MHNRSGEVWSRKTIRRVFLKSRQVGMSHQSWPTLIQSMRHDSEVEECTFETMIFLKITWTGTAKRDRMIGPKPGIRIYNVLVTDENNNVRHETFRETGDNLMETDDRLTRIA